MGHSTSAFILTVSSQTTTVPARYSAQFEEMLRRDISGSFFKDHGQIDKQRLIYWLFTSGKQNAFKALVYLCRDNETTQACVRVEYVVPLTGRIQYQ